MLPVKIQNFLKFLYQNNMNPITNKPTIVTWKTTTAIDHIFTNCFNGTNFKVAIVKININDHFPIGVFFLQWLKTIKTKWNTSIREKLTVKRFKNLIRNCLK